MCDTARGLACSSEFAPHTRLDDSANHLLLCRRECQLLANLYRVRCLNSHAQAVEELARGVSRAVGHGSCKFPSVAVLKGATQPQGGLEVLVSREHETPNDQ